MGNMPDAAPNETENVEQAETIVAHRRSEKNPAASVAQTRRFSYLNTMAELRTLTSMKTESQQFLLSALQLPESDRAEIAASLIRSLDNALDEDADAAWAAEIQRRIQSIDRGDVKLIPWDEVIDQMDGARNESSAD